MTQGLNQFKKIGKIDYIRDEDLIPQLVEFQIACQSQLGKSVFANLLEQSSHQPENLVDIFLHGMKHSLECSLYRASLETKKWIPPSYNYCSEDEKQVNWTEELNQLLTNRLPEQLRQQINTPSKDLAHWVTGLVFLSVQKEIVDQIHDQLNFKSSKYLFAFSSGLFDRVVHYTPYNLGLRMSKVAKCSSINFLRPAKKSN